ncbi:MAG: CpaD family pilus assembly protein [Afipia sp.]|jgi:pilus assembly protein CpaD|nr:CpaD family pilus assembly protein [Afipia sp.]
MTKRLPNLARNLRVAIALLVASVVLAACQTTSDTITTGSVNNDYRQRHPIVIQEANRTTEVFVGTARGGLTASQRADIMGLAQAWLREGTGGIVIDMPIKTPNARVANDSLREIQALLNAAGVPPRGIKTRSYQPSDPRLFATIRVNYPRIIADAGPCGLWPEDLGPSVNNKGYLENRPYHNLGCSTQRNLAAMVDNPADLVQPRAETAAYAARRNAAFEKYRKGTTTATTYPESDKAKISDVGK